jgi:hypothetical protein
LSFWFDIITQELIFKLGTMMLKKVLILAIFGSSVLFGFDLNSAIKSVTSQTTNSTISSKDTSDTSLALKEALQIGAKNAIESLGKENGFLNNANVKIPLPSYLEQVASVAKSVGGEEYANNLILAMNKTASQATLKTVKIFSDTITNISIDDAKKILNDGDNAATTYLKDKSNQKLLAEILPIVKQSMANNDVASYLQAFNNYYKSSGIQKSVSGYASSFGLDKYVPSSNDADLETYITNKTIDGIFVMIAENEKGIRNSSLMQTTDLLKKVFGTK